MLSFLDGPTRRRVYSPRKGRGSLAMVGTYLALPLEYHRSQVNAPGLWSPQSRVNREIQRETTSLPRVFSFWSVFIYPKSHEGVFLESTVNYHTGPDPLGGAPPVVSKAKASVLYWVGKLNDLRIP